MRAKRIRVISLVLGAAALSLTPSVASAQGKSQNGSGPGLTASAYITLTKDMRVEIQSWYVRNPVGNVEALPPGIRKRLARGKPLPPGIAKQVAPAGLHSRIRLPDGYRVLEGGLDVLLVEGATGIVHDIMMDAVR